MPDFASPTFEKLLDFAVFERGEAVAGRARANSLPHVLGLHVFPGTRGGLLTCRLAPNVRQAVAGGVEVGGISPYPLPPPCLGGLFVLPECSGHP